MSKVLYFLKFLLFIIGIGVLLIYGATTVIFDKTEYHQIPLSFLFKIKSVYLIILCVVLTIPFIVNELNESLTSCYMDISNYLGTMTMINRCKTNGHGNPYTEEEQKQLDLLNRKIRKLEHKAKILKIFLLRFY